MNETFEKTTALIGLKNATVQHQFVLFLISIFSQVFSTTWNSTEVFHLCHYFTNRTPVWLTPLRFDWIWFGFFWFLDLKFEVSVSKSVRFVKEKDRNIGRFHRFNTVPLSQFHLFLLENPSLEEKIDLIWSVREHSKVFHRKFAHNFFFLWRAVFICL